MQGVRSRLQPAQVRLYNFLTQRNLPLKFLLFTLSLEQRSKLITDAFTVIFADESHPNPQEAFRTLKMFLSYFDIGKGLMEVDKSEVLLFRFTTYKDWFISKL